MPEPSQYVADEFFPGLVRVLSLLEPHLSDVVLVGGWVPYLMSSQHRDDAPGEPLLTKDIDIAVPRELWVGGDGVDRRLREAGLEYSYRSMVDPPVVSFVGTLDGCEVEVEFLTDEPGGEEQVLDVGGGLRVQSLHYTSVLLDNTMTIPVEAPDGHLLPVRVPTPAAFVFNKCLTFAQRKTPLKKAKDLYYVFGVLDSHQDSLPELAAEMIRIGERYPGKWFKRLANNLTNGFKQSGDEGVRLVVSQRPTRAFVDLGDEQFAQYVFVTFRDFLHLLIS
jgi:hypothetical protein